jgi:hypothetical protein
MSQPETFRFVILNLKVLTWVATFSFYGSWDSLALATFTARNDSARAKLVENIRCVGQIQAGEAERRKLSRDTIPRRPFRWWDDWHPGWG